MSLHVRAHAQSNMGVHMQPFAIGLTNQNQSLDPSCVKDYANFSQHQMTP